MIGCCKSRDEFLPVRVDLLLFTEILYEIPPMTWAKQNKHYLTQVKSP